MNSQKITVAVVIISLPRIGNSRPYTFVTEKTFSVNISELCMMQIITENMIALRNIEI